MFALQSPEEVGPLIRLVDGASLVIELLAVFIIIASVLYFTGAFVFRAIRKRETEAGYRYMKRGLGSALLLGLEILVAADIVRTVVLEPTLESVGILALLVVVRTFLSWSLVVEIEGHWPWKKTELESKREAAGAVEGPAPEHG
jgi:uncharacterized membrane protein